MTSDRLAGLRILIVEDEYFLADEARGLLAEVGAEVIGPVPTANQASALIDGDRAIDGALLDVNLGGEMAFDVADKLQARGIPFAFLTGYDRSVLTDRFTDTASLGKPVCAEQLIEVVEQLASRAPAPQVSG